MARLLRVLLLLALCAACAGELRGNASVPVAGAAPLLQPPPLVTYKFGAGYAPYSRQAGVYSQYSGNGTTVRTAAGPIQLLSA